MPLFFFNLVVNTKIIIKLLGYKVTKILNFVPLCLCNLESQKKMSKILIIEDEAAIRRVLVKILSEENDSYQVDEAEDGVAGLEKIKNNDYDLVLCDIKMPKMDGVELLEAVKKIKPEIPMVMISGHGDMETAINTMRLGAFDYISKPPDLNRLLNTVRNALDRKQLVVENKILKKKVSKNYEMIGDSDAINQIKDMIDKVAPTEARVLITGPNGTGKELVAHQLHEKSERSTAPLIEVNCAAIPYYSNNRVVAVLGVSGPAFRFKLPEMLQAITIMNSLK